MRRYSVAIPVLVTGVCIYFVCAFGREAAIIFSSPIWGLENEVFARAVYDIGRLAALDPGGLDPACGIHGRAETRRRGGVRAASDRPVYPLRKNEINHELLDAGALLAVCSTFIAAMPALLESSPQLLASHRPALWLAGLAATLSMIERIAESEKPGEAIAVPSAIVALPPRRRGVSALRWDFLRRQAGG
jgi:hypothetical protein